MSLDARRLTLREESEKRWSLGDNIDVLLKKRYTATATTTFSPLLLSMTKETIHVKAHPESESAQ